MRLRIAASFAVGVVVIGVLGWPLVAPATPFDTVTVVQGNIGVIDMVIVVFLALLTGFIAYLVSWPFGREVGVLSAPAGLAVWAVRSGSMSDLLRLSYPVPERQMAYAALRWEGMLWLVITLAGFYGVFLAWKLVPNKDEPAGTWKEQAIGTTKIINIILTILMTTLIAQISIGVFAKDVQMPDRQLTVVLAQPAIGQIAFAVLLAFGIAAFAAKVLLNAGYIWPVITTAVLAWVAMNMTGKTSLLQYMAEQWPPAFFPNSAAVILPIQLIAFGSLGSLAGYWLAIRYNYWRKYCKN